MKGDAPCEERPGELVEARRSEHTPGKIYYLGTETFHSVHGEQPVATVLVKGCKEVTETKVLCFTKGAPGGDQEEPPVRLSADEVRDFFERLHGIKPLPAKGAQGEAAQTAVLLSGEAS